MQTRIVAIVLAASCLFADAAWLRGHAASMAPESPAEVQGDVKHEVLEKTSLTKNSTSDCRCNEGYFWHDKIQDCVEQGGFGYECGYFPSKIHNRVCKDGYKCVLVEDTQAKYVHKGAVPGSCRPCEKDDNCLTGENRSAKDCNKTFVLSGSACQTVKVTVSAKANAEATEKVTKSITQEAKASATSQQTVDGVTYEAKAEGQATATAEADAEASAKAEATAKGSGTGKACVPVDEVKQLAGIADKHAAHIDDELALSAISRGDKEAFDKAHAKALEVARKASSKNAMDAAKAKASKKAKEQAAVEAEKKAKKAALSKAKEAAKKEAQEKAKAAALAKAEAAAKKKKDKKTAEKKEEKPQPKSKADAAAKAAKAKQDLADVINPKPTEAPVRPEKPKPTSPPRKISSEDLAAKMP